MNQSNLLQRFCSEHTCETMIFACLDKDCVNGKKSRIICSECLANGYHSHIKNRVTYKLLDETLHKISFDVSKLIDTINNYVLSFQSLLNQLKKYVSNSYGISIQHLNQMQNKEFNECLKLMINYNNVEKEISEFLEKYWNDFSITINKISTINNKQNNLDQSIIDQQIDDLYQKGSQQFEDKNYENALKLFDQVLNINSNHIEALAHKGRTIYYLLKDEESIEWFEKALKLNNQNLMALYGKGDALRMLEKDQESIEWFNKALKIHPQCKYALSGKGDALRMLDQYKESLQWYDKALEVDFKCVNALSGKGDALRMLGQYKESLEFLNKALEIDPNYSLALGSKSASLLEIDKFQESEICLKKALSLDPNNEFAKNIQRQLNQKKKNK